MDVLSAQAPEHSPDGLDFENTSGLQSRTDAPGTIEVLPPAAVGVITGTLVVLLAWGCYLAARALVKRHHAGNASARGAGMAWRGVPVWHALSLIVVCFLGLNVLFGGVTALLLNGNEEDAREYFSQVSALKLSRLAHEHFFGYGLLFGVTGFLVVTFVGVRMRTLFPLFLCFGFSALDSVSWWLSRFVSPRFHLLTFLTGGVFAVAFLVLFVQVARANVRGMRGLVVAVLCLGWVFPEARAQDLNFDAPEVAPMSSSAVPERVGPFENLTLGGAVDLRLTHVNGMSRPVAFIHVNELVVGASVGDHITVSAEQLLLTSERGTVVGQDHGFATVSLIQLPFLPRGTTVKLGRFRGRFGLDAQVDSPANIFPSQALRSNGFVTDIGVALDYAVGMFEFQIEVFNGPDYRTQTPANTRTYLAVAKVPLQGRIVIHPTSRLVLGLSALVGETWDNQLDPTVLEGGMLGSRIDTSRVIERRRGAFDAVFRTPWVDVVGEVIVGQDRGRLSQSPGRTSSPARGGLGRLDVPLGNITPDTRSRLSLQYDAWQDASYAGRVAFLSTAFSVLNDDGWTARVGGSASDALFRATRPAAFSVAPWSVTSQLLVTF